MLSQSPKIVGRVAQAKMLDGCLAQAPLPLEIIHTDSADASIEETRAEEPCRLEVGFKHTLAGNAPLFGRSRLSWER